MPVDAAVAGRIRHLALQNALEHDGRAEPGPILSRLLAADPALRSRAGELSPTVDAIVREISGLSSEAQRSELALLGGEEQTTARPAGGSTASFPELPGAVPGQVVLRLAPFPSGTLHIGNARMVFVNDHYRRRYDGKLLLVFDDTIGSEDKRVDPELFDLIRQDLDRAGAAPDAVYYKSDRIPRFYPWARRVIQAGAAYVCRCPAALLRENRAGGVACPERSEGIPETLDHWQGMLDGRYAEGQAVLRLKTDMADPDPAFRDRVLFRISERDHPRVGHRYRVWPLLEFSWAVDDVELGVTHVLRGKDLVIEDRMEQFLWDLLKETGPSFAHWGLLRVREAKLSKSKSYREVKSGEYDGWADPRTWSLASLDRRGISMEAVRRFTLSFGMSLADVEVPAETLYAENRSIIDATTSRRSFVADPVRVNVTGFPGELSRVDLPNHPDLPALGSRVVEAGPSFWLARQDLSMRAGMEVRLKDLVNVELPREIPSTGTGPIVAPFTSRPNKKLPRLQWVGASGSAEVDLLGTEGQHTHGIGEGSLVNSPPGAIYQFERVGFVRVEADWPQGTLPVRVCFGHP